MLHGLYVGACVRACVSACVNSILVPLAKKKNRIYQRLCTCVRPFLIPTQYVPHGVIVWPRIDPHPTSPSICHTLPPIPQRSRTSSRNPYKGNVFYIQGRAQGLTGSTDTATLHYLMAFQLSQTNKQTNKLRGPQSASELYRLSDRHVSTKFSADFCEQRGVAWSAPHLSSQGLSGPRSRPTATQRIW
jgi:hypothetical protein